MGLLPIRGAFAPWGATFFIVVVVTMPAMPRSMAIMA